MKTLRKHGACICAVALLAALPLAPAASSAERVRCSSPGEWPHTADAAWLTRALARAGLAYGCTGSAFVVDLGGAASAGQIYVWTTHGGSLSYPGTSIRVGGSTVRRDAIRGVWRAHHLHVWVQTASRGPLLPARRWASIVRATTRRS